MTTQTQSFIHRYIPSADPTAQTLLLLHGTGGNEDSLLQLGKQFSPNSAILSPRGKALEGNYPRFFRRYAEGVIDQEDLLLRTHELADWIEVAVSEYGINPESLVAVGYSNGANVAANILLQRPTVLKHAILLRAAMLATSLPAESPDLTGADVLISAGKRDSMLPLADAEYLATTLRNYGAQVTLEAQQADHGLVSGDISTVRAWLQSHLTVNPS